MMTPRGYGMQYVIIGRSKQSGYSVFWRYYNPLIPFAVTLNLKDAHIFNSLEEAKSALVTIRKMSPYGDSKANNADEYEYFVVALC